MAIFCVIEFANVPILSGALGTDIPVGRFDHKVVWQTPITLSGSSQASATFSATTNFIRIHNSGICNFMIGAPGTTASVGGAGRLPADHTEYLGVIPGDIIAVINDT
jgi:hypothetical protein